MDRGTWWAKGGLQSMGSQKSEKGKTPDLKRIKDKELQQISYDHDGHNGIEYHRNDIDRTPRSVRYLSRKLLSSRESCFLPALLIYLIAGRILIILLILILLILILLVLLVVLLIIVLISSDRRHTCRGPP